MLKQFMWYSSVSFLNHLDVEVCQILFVFKFNYEFDSRTTQATQGHLNTATFLPHCCAVLEAGAFSWAPIPSATSAGSG